MPPTTRRAAAAARLHQQPPAAPSTAPPPAWRKVLYEQPAGLADNYTDATFLQHLVVNAKVPQRHYWSVVQDAVAVVQQINVVAAVVVAAVQLHEVCICTLWATAQHPVVTELLCGCYALNTP